MLPGVNNAVYHLEVHSNDISKTKGKPKMSLRTPAQERKLVNVGISPVNSDEVSIYDIIVHSMKSPITDSLYFI